MLAAVPTTVADAINRYRQGLTDTPTASASDPTTGGANRSNTGGNPDAAYKSMHVILSHHYALTSLKFIPSLPDSLAGTKGSGIPSDSWYKQAEHALTGLATI